MIRNIEDSDIIALKELHDQFFAKEFTFNDFLHGAIHSFLLTDDASGDIVTACCIRPIAEMTAITNLNKSPRIRRNALYDALQIANYVLRDSTMNQLHAFVQDPKWETQLIHAGFKRCSGKAVYINL